MLDVRSIADIPCGDWNWMRTLIDTPHFRKVERYYGGDVVPGLVGALRSSFGSERVQFLPFDLMTQPLFPVDLLIVRDILFHFRTQQGLDVLKNAHNSGSRYLLSTYFPGYDNGKRRPGGSGHSGFAPLDLETPPYNLGPPLLAIGYDGPPPGRAGVWNGKVGQRVMGLWTLPLREGALLEAR